MEKRHLSRCGIKKSKSPKRQPMLWFLSRSVISNALHIPLRNSLFHRTPPQHPNISSLEIGVAHTLLLLHFDLPSISEHAHKYRGVLVRLVHHGNPTSRIIELLQRSRKVLQKRSPIVGGEQRLMGVEILRLQRRKEWLIWVAGGGSLEVVVGILVDLRQTIVSLARFHFV